jgi:hypothetical protein
MSATEATLDKDLADMLKAKPHIPREQQAAFEADLNELLAAKALAKRNRRYLDLSLEGSQKARRGVGAAAGATALAGIPSAMYLSKDRDTPIDKAKDMLKLSTIQDIYTLIKNADKVEKVMSEYKHGKLKSSSGDKVKDRDQAIAIALSEARRAGEDVPKKKATCALPGHAAQPAVVSKHVSIQIKGKKKDKKKKDKEEKRSADMIDAWADGFVKACRERGVDPETFIADLEVV